jgi:hypothetical protein
VNFLHGEQHTYLATHSLSGLPSNPDWQAQTGSSLTNLQSAFFPQTFSAQSVTFIDFWHATNGSPSYPLLQEHIGLCFFTVHFVFWPQMSWLQGFEHLFLKHDSTSSQSEFEAHSLPLSLATTSSSFSAYFGRSILVKIIIISNWFCG